MLWIMQEQITSRSATVWRCIAL